MCLDISNFGINRQSVCKELLKLSKKGGYFGLESQYKEGKDRSKHLPGSTKYGRGAPLSSKTLQSM
jgi:hypothetical protein